MSTNNEQHENTHLIDVAIGTTSGFFPIEGFEKVPTHQKVRVLLEKASKALNLTNTDGWVATVDKHPINPDLSYLENNLKGNVEIDWGPHEGGGGHA